MRDTAVKCPFCGHVLKGSLRKRIKHREECEKIYKKGVKKCKK